MSDVTPCQHPLTPPKHPHMTITNFNYEGPYLPGVICNIVVKADLGRSPGRCAPQCWHLVVKTGNWQICQQIYSHMHHGIYIMGCIWQPFWILQEKVGISCYFWIIRLVNSQLALYSHVRCKLPQHPHMTITNFNYEGSYLPGLICNIVVKVDLGRSPGRSTPPPKMHHGIYVMGCIGQPFWIL